MTSKSFKNLKDLLQKTGYITQRLANGTSGYANGPSGTLLRHNITNSWLETMVVKSRASFPVTCQETDPLTFYHDILSLRNQTLPFSITHVHSVPAESRTSSLELQSVLNLYTETNLRYLHICQPASLNQTFDQVVNLRMNWWKQFSWKSTDFVQSDASVGDSLGVDIKCEFPWGQETIETIREKGENVFINLEAVTGTSCKVMNGEKQLYPSCIDCCTWLEMALLVFLNNAYTEKQPQDDPSQTRQVLHLHPVLAPYKAALCLTGELKRQISEVGTYVAHTLRQAGIHILDNSNDQNQIDQQIQFYDSIGIPFTVIISDTTIKTGTVELRNRETTLHETLAINKLQEYILKHVTYIQ